jgi:hypothetical protein
MTSDETPAVLAVRSALDASADSESGPGDQDDGEDPFGTEPGPDHDDLDPHVMFTPCLSRRPVDQVQLAARTRKSGKDTDP